MTVLIVEDEKGLAEEIKSYLSTQGYTCEIAATGREASEKIFVNDYDFVLLDLGLPDYDGLDLLKEAREANITSSFVVLTARGAVDDRIRGLDSGADDYLAKPFSLMELLSRMHAIIRRKHSLTSNSIKVHEYTMDIQNRTISCNDKEINLTKKEFDILNYLVLHKNRVLTRLQLTEHIWGDIIEDSFDSNYIDVHIKNIRKKLTAYGSTDWIETVRGIGYKVKL